MSLLKDPCRLNIRKYSFSHRTINEWNILYVGCVNASIVNMFKNKMYISGERVTHNERFWTLDKPVASLSSLCFG